MIIDIMCGIFVILSALVGYRNGALLTLLRLCALVLAVIAARHIGEALAGPLGESLDTGPVMATGIAFVLSFVSALLLLRLLANIISKAVVPEDGVLGSINRVLGGALGLATAALLVFVALSALLLASTRLGPILPTMQIDLSGSRAASLVAQYNLFDFVRIPQMERLHSMARALEAANDPAPHSKADDIRLAGYAALARDSRASFMEDPELLRAIAEEKWGRVLTDPRVWAFVTDPEVAERIDAIERRAAAAELDQ